MLRQLAAAGVVCAGCVAASGTQTALALTSTVRVRTDGIVLTLSLPRRSYPENALVQATVRLKNVSATTVHVSGRGIFCRGQDSLGAVVQDTHEQTLYPPVFGSGGGLGPPSPDTLVQPGQAVSRTMYLVLRGPSVRAQVLLDDIPAAGMSPAPVATPPLRVRLTAGTPPQVRFKAIVGGVEAIVHSRGPHHGPPLAVSASDCRGSDGTQLGGVGDFDDWVPAFDSKVKLFCPSLVTWEVMVGWLNEPVTIARHMPPS